MNKTYLYAGTSILLWSTLATVSKLLLNSFDSFQVLCISALFAFVFLLVVNILTGNIKKMRCYKGKDFLILSLIGLPGTLFYNLFLFAGTARMQASQAFIINYLWPIMSVIFACILLKEKLTFRKGIAIALSFIGVIIVTGGDLANFDSNTIFGAFFCVLAAVSYGLFTALNQKYHYDKSLSIMFFYFVTFVLTGIINLGIGNSLSFGFMEGLGFAWSGIATMAVATITWTLALDSGKTAKISNLAYITPFLSLIWTLIFLHEPITPSSVAGLIVIIVGILLQLKDQK